ncbi:MAG: hypothetical protein R2865_17300 [Deinococcales bacterium]
MPCQLRRDPLAVARHPQVKLNRHDAERFLCAQCRAWPNLFASRPEFIMGLYLNLLITNFVILIFLMFSTRWLIKITAVDPASSG